MENHTIADFEKGPLAWLDIEIELVMGPAGADYTAEPVTVYMLCAREIRRLNCALKSISDLAVIASAERRE